MPQSMHGPGSHVAPADQTTDPTGGPGGGDIADAEALARALGVSAGDKLDGRYRLDRVLHLTGPALTWLATDEKLNRASRIHLLRSNEPRAQAFMEAARAAAAMPDNHFVQVLDAVPDEGVYYVITEWLHDGRTLSEVLAAGPVPVTEAIRITSELARAMAEAHESGLAHLRLSPKTVLRTDTGEVKILDLCLAAALTGTVSRDPLGTDLTAIGELAYAMLTGKRPGSEPTPPSELRPEVPPQLDEVVLRTLGDPSAGEPYQSPVDVIEALAKLPRPRYEEPLRSTPQTAPLRHAQTTVMPASNHAPAYETSQMRAEPRTAVTHHGGSHGGGGHRPAAFSRDDGFAGANSKNMKIGIGAVAAVAAVALLAWQLMGSGGGKGAAAGASGGSSAAQSQSSNTTPSAVGGPIVIAAASVYDADDGTEGKGGVTTLNTGTGKWSTQSYCQGQPTYNGGKPKAGTGVVFDLGASKQITSATVGVLTAGANVEMWTGDAAPANKPGSAPDGFKKVASATAATSFDLKPDAPVTARYVLIWFISLPAEPTTNAAIKCAHSDGHTYGDSILSVKFNGP